MTGFFQHNFRVHLCFGLIKLYLCFVNYVKLYISIYPFINLWIYGLVPLPWTHGLFLTITCKGAMNIYI